MRILIITHNLIPQPSSNGSAIHIWSIINALQERGHEVHLLIYGVTEYSPVSGWKNANKEFIKHNLELRGVDVHLLAKKELASIQRQNSKGNSFVKLIKKFISPEPKDFYEGPYYQQEIQEYGRLIQAEVVIAYSFESISAACVFYGEIPIVAVTVDLDHIVRALRLPKPQTFNLKASALNCYQKLLISRLSSVEISLLKQCDLVFSHAAQHSEWLRHHGIEKTVYLPVAVPDRAREFFSREKDNNNPLRIIMVGAVNATETSRGIRLLTKQVLPELDVRWHKTPDFELQIFGAGKVDEPTRKMLDYEWLKIMGFVEDIGKEFYNSDILLVPNPDNVGFRTRISEGFSYGCCVVTHVSNTLGMPEIRNEENSLVCRTNQEFVSAISRCLESSDLRRRLSIAARKTYIEELDGSKVGQKISSALEQLAANYKTVLSQH